MGHHSEVHGVAERVADIVASLSLLLSIRYIPRILCNKDVKRILYKQRLQKEPALCWLFCLVMYWNLRPAVAAVVVVVVAASVAAVVDSTAQAEVQLTQGTGSSQSRALGMQ